MTINNEKDALAIGDFIFRIFIIIGILLGIIIANIYNSGLCFVLIASGSTIIGLIISFIISHKFL